MNSNATNALIASGPRMLQSLREETEGKLQMLASPKKNSADSLFKEVRGFQGFGVQMLPFPCARGFEENPDLNSSRREHKGRWMGIFLDAETSLPGIGAFWSGGNRNASVSKFSRIFSACLQPTPQIFTSNTFTRKYWEPKTNPQSQKIARTAPKNFLNNSRGLPVIIH